MEQEKSPCNGSTEADAASNFQAYECNVVRVPNVLEHKRFSTLKYRSKIVPTAAPDQRQAKAPQSHLRNWALVLRESARKRPVILVVQYW
jgi:hypothetical protein